MSESIPKDPEVRDALRRNFLFSTLDEQEIDALLEEVRIRHFDEGELIVREGDPALSLYLVVRGTVNVLKSGNQFLALLGANGFFGEMALAGDRAFRSADCVAASDTTCAVVDRKLLDRFCLSMPVAGLKIFRVIAKTLSERLQATSADLAMLMAAGVNGQNDVAEIVEKAQEAKRGPTQQDIQDLVQRAKSRKIAKPQS